MCLLLGDYAALHRHSASLCGVHAIVVRDDVALTHTYRTECRARSLSPRSDFLKFYKYVNTVKQFSEKEAAQQVRT